MFHIRLVARPDARMVEVPLEIEAALPRDFDGVVMLASSGLPRKVRIKAPSDAFKLSTAYRLERMLGDVVRLTLRGNLQDNARVQDAARAYIKGVRERRRDGATLLVQGDGSGKIEVSESAAPASGPSPAGASPAAGSTPPAAAAASKAHAAASAPPPTSSPAADAPPAAPQSPGGGSLADRILALERKLAALEPSLSRAAGGASAAESSLDARVLRLEEELGLGAPEGGAGRKAHKPTAVDAFAEGLRGELRSRATQLLGAADRAASACDKAVWLAADAARQLGCDPEAAEQRDLRRLAAEAGARQVSLQMFVGDLEQSPPAELLIGERLLERLSGKDAADGTAPLDPAPHLASLAAPLLRASPPRPGLGPWIESAAPLCGWTLVAPAAGERLDPELHEAVEGTAPQGEPGTVGRLVVPGVRKADGSLLARARVIAAGRPEGAGEDLVVSDRDVEEIHDLAGSSDKPFAPRGGAAEGGSA